MSGISGVTPDELSAEFTELKDPDTKGYRSTSIDVDLALQEIRKFTLREPMETTSTASGTLNLDNTSNTVQIILGTAIGYSVELPDATTISAGSTYFIANQSSESIEIKDGAGTVLLTLIAGDTIEALLETAGSVAGTWITIITSGSATGITSFVVTSNTTFVTSSSSDVIITGFTVIPVQGRYYVAFSADLTISNNNRLAECVVYAGGVANENTRRQVQGVSSNFSSSFNTIGEITVDGSEAVDVRVNITANTLTVTNRSMILIRLGS